MFLPGSKGTPAQDAKSFVWNQTKGGGGGPLFILKKKFSWRTLPFLSLFALFTYFIRNTWEPRVQQAEFIHSLIFYESTLWGSFLSCCHTIEGSPDLWGPPSSGMEGYSACILFKNHTPLLSTSSLLKHGPHHLFQCSHCEAAFLRHQLWECDPLFLVLGQNWAPSGRTQLKQDWAHKPAGRGVSNLDGISRKTHPWDIALHII